MIRKYGKKVTSLLVVVLCTGVIVHYFPQKALRECVPQMFYLTESNPFEARVKYKIGNILPVLVYSSNHKIIKHREDVIQLKKIKPVEILTMMELENIQGKKQNQMIEQDTIQELAQEDALTAVSVEKEVVKGVIEKTSGFVPHTLQQVIDIQSLSDYEKLKKEFYIVDSVAMVDSDLLDVNSLNSRDLRISKEAEGPQILIYHTHSQEAFADSVVGEEATTIVGVGAHLAELLRNEYGYEVIHHKGQYDVKTRDNAYSRALPEVEKILDENPSIQVVIDLHRDGIAEDANKLVMDLDGRPTAKFMFFNGVSCSKKTGNIDYLYNPNLKDNMAFSFQLKKVAEEYYPGLSRKNYINAYRYNMHVCGRTTLLELGAQNNTLEEAMNACDPIAHILDMVLSGA